MEYLWIPVIINAVLAAVLLVLAILACCCWLRKRDARQRQIESDLERGAQGQYFEQSVVAVTANTSSPTRDPTNVPLQYLKPSNGPEEIGEVEPANQESFILEHGNIEPDIKRGSEGEYFEQPVAGNPNTASINQGQLSVPLQFLRPFDRPAETGQAEPVSFSSERRTLQVKRISKFEGIPNELQKKHFCEPQLTLAKAIQVSKTRPQFCPETGEIFANTIY